MPTTPAERCARLTHEARLTHIIEAAIRLFAQKGFQGTKTKEIAEAAGINEALIFRDFQSKDKLYCAIIEYASRRINPEAWIQEMNPYAERGDDAALFSTLAIKLFSSYGQEHTLFRLMLYCALEHHELSRQFRDRQVAPIERFIEGYVRARQQQGAFRQGDPHALARSFLSMCHHHVLRQVLFGEAVAPADEAAARTFSEVFLDGVRTH